MEHATLVGGSIPSLIGLLNRPAGAIAGDEQVAGLRIDKDAIQVAADFLDDLTRALAPGKFAVVAYIEEEWTPWIDLRMRELGGSVCRCPFAAVREAANLQAIAAMRADLARMKAEHDHASAARRTKLHQRINALETKIQQHLESAQKRRAVDIAEAQKKADALAMKAAQAPGRKDHRQKANQDCPHAGRLDLECFATALSARPRTMLPRAGPQRLGRT